MHTPSSFFLSRLTLLRAWVPTLLFGFLASPLLAQVPVITGAGEAGASLGNVFTYRIQASNRPTGFIATGLPPGLTINSTTGLIRGKPTKSGTFRVTVSVRNATGVSKSRILIITVGPARPVITSALKAAATVGVSFTYQITARNKPVGFGATGLPAGLKLNSKTGLISGIPKAAGRYSIKLSARNSKGTGAAVLSLTIAAKSADNLVFVQGGTLPKTSELAGQKVSSFRIGKYEVTLKEWREIRDWAVKNGYNDIANTGNASATNHPVQNVSWYDVVKWCNAKSQLSGLSPVYTVNGTIFKTGSLGTFESSLVKFNTSANGYRLPAEAEWEWAARGGVKTKNYTFSGSNDADKVAWIYENSPQGPKPVGSKLSNELGIHDMSGNTWEWCWEDISPYRRIRGGGWIPDKSPSNDFLKVGHRSFSWVFPDPNVRGFIGFRLARNAP